MVAGADPTQVSALHASLPHHLDLLDDLAPCGYLSTAADGVILEVNETLLAWTGFSRDELVGRRRFVDLLTGGGRIYHETHYAPMLRLQGSVREIALDVVRADGERLPVLVNATLVPEQPGRVALVRIAVFDATERRGYERELLHAKQRAEASESRARALAQTLQQTLVPPTPPVIPGLDVAAVYRPAGDGAEVGGDFYDVFQVGAGDWVVVLGDVCGKGVEAAVVTGLARYTLRAAAVQLDDPKDTLAALNKVLLHHASDRFCTVAVLRLRIDTRGWAVTMASGGHPLPLLLRPGRAPVALGDTGPLVGVLEHPEFSDHRLLLEPGDALLLYTDGVVEGRRDREFYGEARLLSWVEAFSGSIMELVGDLLSAVLAFQRDLPRDDIAIMGVQVPEVADRSK